MIIPRDYQIEAVDAIEQYFLETTKGNPGVIIPPGGGKSLIMAMIVKRFREKYNKRIGILTHVKELIMQNYDSAVDYWPEGRNDFGVYSAGLRCRDTDHPVIFGSIQSLFERAEEVGKLNVLIIDECQRIQLVGNGQYRTLIDALLEINPKMRIVGLSAFASRLDSGSVCGWTENHILNEVIYEVPWKELIARGYLVDMISTKEKLPRADTSNVPIGQNGDFVQYALEAIASEDALVKAQVDDLIRLSKGRKYWCIFCVGIQHATIVADELKARGITTALLHSELGNGERDQIVKDHKAGKYQAFVNVDIASVGYDFDKFDVIALMRDTESMGVYLQQCGRGTRVEKVICCCGAKSVEREDYCQACGLPIFRDKFNCLILDFAGLIGKFGPVDKIKSGASYLIEEPEKNAVRICPECENENRIVFKECQYCGYVFPKKDRANTSNPLANLDHHVMSKPRKFKVEETTYSKVGEKLIVHYWCGGEKFFQKFDSKTLPDLVNERRLEDIPVPKTADMFKKQGYDSKLKVPITITVNDCGRIQEITEMQF